MKEIRIARRQREIESVRAWLQNCMYPNSQREKNGDVQLIGDSSALFGM